MSVTQRQSDLDNNLTASEVYTDEDVLGIHLADSRSKAQIIIESLILILILVPGIIGNLLVIIVTAVKLKVPNIPMVLIINLAVSDILMATISGFFTLYILTSSTWPFSMGVCRFFAIHTYGVCNVSVCTLTTIAINRYFIVCRHTLDSRAVFSKKRTIFLIVLAIWLLSIGAIVVPVETGWANIFLVFEPALCVLGHSATYDIFSMLLAVMVPNSIMTYCFFSIMRVVRESEKRVQAAGQSQVESGGSKVVILVQPAHLSSSEMAMAAPRSRKTEMKLARTFFAIYLVFNACYLPVVFVSGFEYWNNGNVVLGRGWKLYATFSLFMSSAINPIIYGLSYKEFRSTLKDFFYACRRNSTGN